MASRKIIGPLVRMMTGQPEPLWITGFAVQAHVIGPDRSSSRTGSPGWRDGAGDMTGKVQRSPPDCRRIVIRLRYGIEGGCNGRTTSTGETAWSAYIAKPPLTPPPTNGSAAVSPMGGGAAYRDHGRAGPSLRITALPPRCPELPSTANGRHRQHPVNLKVARALNPRATHVTPS